MPALFACPRRADGHIALIQANALASWTALGFGPLYPLVLLAEETLERDAFGTPLVSSVFQEGERATDSPVLIYANADIIFLDDLVPAIQTVAARFPGRFLMVGQRIDLDVTAPLDRSGDWCARLREVAYREGRLHQPAGLDYFVYWRGTMGDLPPFTLGRWRWDNWIVWDALARGIPVVDATADVTVIHQNHDHAHHGTTGAIQRERNTALAVLTGARLCGANDATYELRGGAVVRR